jgi:hypothetical protein
MASNGKRKTTMAKLNRESKLRERRMEKHARKDARKQTAADQDANPTEMSEQQSDGDAAQVASGDEAQLPSGDATQLPSGDAAQLASDASPLTEPAELQPAPTV